MVSRILSFLIIVVLICTAGYYLYYYKEPVCLVCERPLHKATHYRLHLSRGGIVEVCCPRCGLHFQQGRNDVHKVEVADFGSGELLDARQAYYVEGSSVHVCCFEGDVQKDRSGVQYERTWDRCLPSLVAFKNQEKANQFMGEHGGVLRVYSELTLENAEEH